SDQIGSTIFNMLSDVMGVGGKKSNMINSIIEKIKTSIDPKTGKLDEKTILEIFSKFPIPAAIRDKLIHVVKEFASGINVNDLVDGEKGINIIKEQTEKIFKTVSESTTD